jgi:predicted peroxiredoxin
MLIMKKSIEDILQKPSSNAFILRPEQISSEVFIIAPTQINYIAEIFANSMADSMNMRAFAPKIRHLAEKSLRAALQTAKKQGAL